MEDLLPCPFCGRTAVYCTNGYDGDLVTCSNDECNISDTSWEPSWWNKQATMEKWLMDRKALVKEISKLKKIISLKNNAVKRLEN